MHFYEWPSDHFSHNLKTDLGEKKNIAKANLAQAGKMYDQMMARLKAVGGYFSKPNPKADPKAKRYDPSNPADKGEGGDPEAGDDGEKAKKGGNAKARSDPDATSHDETLFTRTCRCLAAHFARC